MYRIYSSANTTKAQHTTNIHGILVTKGNLHGSTSSVPHAKLSPSHLIKDRAVRKSGEEEST